MFPNITSWLDCFYLSSPKLYHYCHVIQEKKNKTNFSNHLKACTFFWSLHTSKLIYFNSFSLSTNTSENQYSFYQLIFNFIKWKAAPEIKWWSPHIVLITIITLPSPLITIHPHHPPYSIVHSPNWVDS